MDKNYWKDKYKDYWKNGNEREALFKSYMKSIGYDLQDNGLGVMSEEYIDTKSEEKGKPDFYAMMPTYFEVTGTDNENVKEDDVLWVRPDKVKYAKKHKLRVYLIHIINQKNFFLMRGKLMKEIDETKLVYPIVRGTKETYVGVQPKDVFTIKREEQKSNV